MDKEYIDNPIKQEINKKINTINKTRNSRINASKRLYNYAEHWELLFFFFNTLAIVYVLIAALNIHGDVFTSVTGFFTLYVILLQYYISKKNFKERALRFHYHQLELEKNILSLKMLLIENEDTNKVKLKKRYRAIMNEYSLNLINIENHDDSDYKKTIEERNQNDEIHETADEKTEEISKEKESNNVEKINSSTNKKSVIGNVVQNLTVKKEYLFLIFNYTILLVFIGILLWECVS